MFCLLCECQAALVLLHVARAMAEKKLPCTLCLLDCWACYCCDKKSGLRSMPASRQCALWKCYNFLNTWTWKTNTTSALMHLRVTCLSLVNWFFDSNRDFSFHPVRSWFVGLRLYDFLFVMTLLMCQVSQRHRLSSGCTNVARNLSLAWHVICNSSCFVSWRFPSKFWAQNMAVWTIILYVSDACIVACVWSCIFLIAIVYCEIQRSACVLHHVTRLFVHSIVSEI
jgi:hypothetical protein